MLGILVLSINTYGQNAIKIVNGIYGISTKSVCRTVNIHIGGYWVAESALLAHNPTKIDWSNTYCAVQIATEKAILARSIASPTTIYGPYNYLKKIAEATKDEDLVNPKYVDVWKHINTSGYYNGAHHIINKSVIKMIHADLKKIGKKENLESMERNAPALFHPMHGNPRYVDVFHNPYEQYEIYRASGVKGLMEHQINKINDLNRHLGIPEIDEKMQDGLMKEARLWCEIYRVRF